MTERYAAFVSYSHSDEGVARWLHRAIEGYRFTKALRGEATEFGPVPAKLMPVFRDRDELAASGDLGAELRAALDAARFQIVLCSPRAAQSKWVNEEILVFKRTHGEHRTLALIVEGEPYAGGAEECFPPALRYKLAPDGALSEEPAEPIAADIRKGKDGKRLALMKLLAGISGTRLDQLVRRDAARRQRRLAFVAAGSGLVALTTIGLAIYAESQRRVAVEQRDMAEASLAFLTGTFEVANPATENPKTITALTVLDRASKRAAKEFAGKPEIAANLLRTTGRIYYNLGLPKEADRDLRAALGFAPEGSEDRVEILFALADLAKNASDPAEMQKWINAAEGSTNASQNAGLTARADNLQAQIAYLRGDYTGSATRFRDVRLQLGDLPGDNREAIANAISNEAQSRMQAGQKEKSATLFRDARRMNEAIFGFADVRTANALQNEAYATLEKGDPSRAAETMARALSVYRRVLEPDHPRLADAALLDGRINTAAGRTAAALRSFQNARTIALRLYGADNALIGDIDFYTAESLGKTGRTDDALVVADRVKKVYDYNYGAKDPDQAELLLLRARILSRGGRREQALANCLSALALRKTLKLDAATLDETIKTCDSYSKLS